MLEHERTHLMPMPEPFDGYVEKPARVSSTYLVAVARNRYSVPCELAGQMVSTQLYPGRVVVVANDSTVAGHDRRSAANQPFSGWDSVFPDPGMTVAAIDRLVHHSTIFELNQVESYRSKEAARQQKIQRDNEKASRRRQSSGDNDNHPREALP